MTIEKISEYDLEKLNNKLRSKYGYGPDGLRPVWKVSWANDLLEKRWMTHDDHGNELLNPEVREVRKYQHIHDRYVLERQVPVQGETDLAGVLVSNEPAWSFEDRHGNYLPPRFDACEFIIERIYSQLTDGQLRKGTYFKKYFDPLATEEQRQQKIKDMEFHLFGNETPVGDALAHKYGVTDFHEKVEFPSHTEETTERS